MAHGDTKALYCQETRPTSDTASCGLSVVVIEHSTKFIATTNWTLSGQFLWKCDEFVYDTLMVSMMPVVINDSIDGLTDTEDGKTLKATLSELMGLNNEQFAGALLH